MSRSDYEHNLVQAVAAMARGDFAGAAGAVRRARGIDGFQRGEEALEAWCDLYVRLPKSRLLDSWPLRQLWGHDGVVSSISLSRDAGYMLTGGVDACLRLWETVSGRCLKTFEGHGGPILAASLIQGGRWAVSGSWEPAADRDQSLKVWELTSGRCVGHLVGHRARITSLAAEPWGPRVVSGSADTTVRLWDLEQRRLLHTLEGHSDVVSSVSLIRSGRRVASGSWDGTLRLWDAATGECLRTIDTGHGFVLAVGGCAGSGIVYSAGEDGRVCQWDGESGERLREFHGHRGPVVSLCAGFDGHTLVSAGDDGTVRIWDADTGEEWQCLAGHGYRTNAVHISMDGRLVASVGNDQSVRLWHLDWELQDRESAEWDEAARSHLDEFLDGFPDRGRAGGAGAWGEREFKILLHRLGCAGYGWLRADGVQRRLSDLAVGGTGR